MGQYRRSRSSGVTLIELLVTIAIVALIANIAHSNYKSYVEKVNIGVAESDIATIASNIDNYSFGNNELPKTLADINMANMLDPWSNAYIYLPFDDNTNRGSMRKDKNLVPVNSDYDLYSMGQDGRTTKPFTSKHGRDDIVRANNGGYIGLAENY